MVFVGEITIALDLVGFMVSLLATIQQCAIPISWLRKYRNSSKEFAETFKHVSYAYSTDGVFIWWKISLTYMEKSTGPRLESWGTLYFVTCKTNITKLQNKAIKIIGGGKFCDRATQY